MCRTASDSCLFFFCPGPVLNIIKLKYKSFAMALIRVVRCFCHCEWSAADSESAFKSRARMPTSEKAERVAKHSNPTGTYADAESSRTCQ
jgi:hypothetical protein